MTIINTEKVQQDDIDRHRQKDKETHILDWIVSSPQIHMLKP